MIYLEHLSNLHTSSVIGNMIDNRKLMHEMLKQKICLILLNTFHISLIKLIIISHTSVIITLHTSLIKILSHAP
jgi:hypothetical protein